MSISVNDVIRITAEQSYAGQSIFNVMFYEVFFVEDTIASAQLLLDAYEQVFKDAVKGVQTTSLDYVNLTLDNLTDGLTFAEKSMTGNGSVAGDTLPTYVAMTVNQKRSTKLTRNGSKRIAGLPESVCSNNTIVVNQVAGDAINAFFGDVVEVDAGIDPLTNIVRMNNVIVGRTLNASGKYALDLSKINLVSSAQFNTTLTSQLTRKP